MEFPEGPSLEEQQELLGQVQRRHAGELIRVGAVRRLIAACVRRVSHKNPEVSDEKLANYARSLEDIPPVTRMYDMYVQQGRIDREYMLGLRAPGRFQTARRIVTVPGILHAKSVVARQTFDRPRGRVPDDPSQVSIDPDFSDVDVALVLGSAAELEELGYTGVLPDLAPALDSINPLYRKRWL